MCYIVVSKGSNTTTKTKENEMELDIRNWNVEIVCDLYHAGMTEDGSPYHAESYYLVIRDIKGKRLAHNMVFKGCEV